jgi:protein arginine kinase activator
MKCDNCGKEEVNFHYTSNINGNITEKHLCSDCAVKLGVAGALDFAGKPAEQGTAQTTPDMTFEEAFRDLFGVQPSRRMFGGFGMMFPTFVIPTVGLIVPGAGSSAREEVPEKTAEIKTEVDDEMRKRRELNVMREQMRQAAEAEDFEKAAALRDSIRALENGENV